MLNQVPDSLKKLTFNLSSDDLRVCDEPEHLELDWKRLNDTLKRLTHLNEVVFIIETGSHALYALWKDHIVGALSEYHAGGLMRIEATRYAIIFRNRQDGLIGKNDLS